MSRNSLRYSTRKLHNQNIRHSSNRIYDTLNDQTFNSVDLEIYIKNTHNKFRAIENANAITKQSAFAANLAVIQAEKAIKIAIHQPHGNIGISLNL